MVRWVDIEFGLKSHVVGLCVGGQIIKAPTYNLPLINIAHLNLRKIKCPQQLNMQLTIQLNILQCVGTVVEVN